MIIEIHECLPFLYARWGHLFVFFSLLPRLSMESNLRKIWSVSFSILAHRQLIKMDSWFFFSYSSTNRSQFYSETLFVKKLISYGKSVYLAASSDFSTVEIGNAQQMWKKTEVIKIDALITTKFTMMVGAHGFVYTNTYIMCSLFHFWRNVHILVWNLKKFKLTTLEIVNT